jgi:hypothetical protein
MKEEIFQLRITLVDSEPPIWRRFQVYNHITFEGLHFIIQAVMGWEGFHSYEFRCKNYTLLMPGSETSPWHKYIQVHSHKKHLFEMLKRTGQKFTYIYDFGDNWEHEIIFEKRLPENPEQSYPVCIDGEMACPPEDIGGTWTFYERLAIARDEIENHDEEWTKHLKGFFDDYDPRYFNLKEINRQLKRESKLEPGENFTLEDIVDYYLGAVDMPFRMEEFFKAMELQKTKENQETIYELMVTSGEVVLDNQSFYPRISFLKDFSLRITPTEYEIEKGILIPGHRLLPFLPLDILSDEARFTHNNTLLEQRGILLSVELLDTYFGLLDTDELPILGPELYSNRDPRVSILVFELAKFYQRNHFEPGDSVILKIEDFYEGIFSIHYDPLSNIKAREKEIKARDKLFIETLKKVLRMNIENNYLEKQLMYTYYNMSRSLTLEQKKIPGTELGVLLSQTREISYSELDDTGKIFHLGDKLVVNISHKDS